MRDADGTYYVTADELRAFRDSGRQYWYMNEDGSTDVYLDEQRALDGTFAWPVYLMDRSDAWFEQWDGDLGRAVAEELNPAVARSVAAVTTEGRWPPA